jgi:predicted metalloprotease
MRFGNDDSDRGNIEDVRGSGGGRIGGIHLGIGGFILVGILSLVFRTNLFSLLGGGSPAVQPQAAGQQVTERKQQENRQEQVAVSSFNDTQHFWARTIPNQWHDAHMVIYWDAVESECGNAESAMGPFYCPRDQKVYIDLGFYQELARRFGAPGEFAQAYVIAHEVGHHVQDLLGITRRIGSKIDSATSVKLELQADCLAGVWGHDAAARKLLDPGEADQGLRAAASVGDDHIQQMSGRRVNTDSFTHGSSEQRAHWFGVGMKTGRMEECDTFRAQ